MAIIDFEASCLPQDNFSYPIEVALATISGESRAWLIRPVPQWKYWDWCPEAEALHGIGREQLAREGLPAEQVLKELAKEAQGHDVYADSDLDAYWLEILAQACGEAPPFPIRFLGEMLQDSGFKRHEVVTALAEAKLQQPTEHVARDDAKRLALAVRLLVAGKSEPGQRAANG